ncbi:MAG: hypothetical protein ACHQJ4_03920 [Ignavibacteria bacterium]
MKTIQFAIVIIAVTFFISGCTKKNETDLTKKDSTAVQNKDSINQKQTLDTQKDEPGYYKLNVPYDDYLKQHPNLSKKIELEDLIEQIAVNKYAENDKRNRVQPWSLLADKNISPVNWLTREKNGVKQGEVILLFNGKPAEILDKYITPVIWDVTLNGAPDGINNVDLSMDILSKSVNNIDIQNLVKKKNITANLLRAAGDQANGEKDYKLVVPEKEPMWMIYTWSCGSGGCTADFNIFYNENNYKSQMDKPKGK